MKLRIALWASVGALVVILWTLCIPVISATSLVRSLMYVTCPVALAGQHAMSFYFVLLVNACTYALLGIIVEAMRRQYRHA